MCALTSSGLDDVSDIVTYILFFFYIYIFVVEGGGQGRGTLGILGGSFYLSNTLDRTLMTKAKKKRLWWLLKYNAQTKKRNGTHIM